MKNSEIFESELNGVVGTHPPLTVVVMVSAARRKMTVAAPVFSTVMLKLSGVRVTELIWKCVRLRI